MIPIIEKFETEKEFEQRPKDGWVANAYRCYDGRSAYMLHESDCKELSRGTNHVEGEQYDKYFSRDLDALRQHFPEAWGCKKCKTPGKGRVDDLNENE